ncbi:hypothetical protein I4U23_001795 [Adineta vaga]|nr:hypothetical protein I4U23_001795 [Adineta vaga]
MDENLNITTTTTTTTTTITDELNSLRSILPSDDHLQIQPSGDFEQVRISLEHGTQVSFFLDSLQMLSQPLTVNNIHDLRISKASSKYSLSQEQWSDIRKYFDETIRHSDKTTLLRSVIQLVQDQLLQIRITATTSETDDSSISNKFRGGDLIFNRILHDKNIDRTQVIIGYEDRFTGIHEIAFNEFKKVHDHEYGVPMHRVRYFKIGGRTVWDRTKKLDLLTGSEQQKIELDDMGQSVPVAEGLYQFDKSLEQWISLPYVSLTSDDIKTTSTNDTILPQNPQLLTWNILFDYHHSSLIYSQQRYHAMLQTLKSLLPDLICLQEVTQPFLKLLLNETWLQENNYYIIIMQSVINSEEKKLYGQLMLMKNFRPRAFSITPLDLLEDDAMTTTSKTTKEMIIARFGLNVKVTIDIVNLHLHSNRSRNADEKRCQALENLIKQLNIQNYMLIGDFNFGDYDLKEQCLLQKYENDVHDLWKDFYDLEQNPGFTYDPSRNLCAQITSRTQINRRFDRYFIHTLKNLYYSVQHLNMIGIDTIPVDSTNGDDSSNKRINISDHYGLQLIIDFQTRSISHRSALVILPSTDHWSMIDNYRQQYDPSYNRWPPHVNVLWPFFDLNGCEDDEENILLPLRLLLSKFGSFDAEVNEIDTFVENNVCFMKMNNKSRSKVQELYEAVKQLFPQCCTNKRNAYNPHMTIAQFDSTEKRIQAMPTLTLESSFTFPVQYLYILQRPLDDDTTPFRIAYQLPLGSILQPSYCQQEQQKLQNFFHQMNLYESEQSYKQKQEKFNKLATCIDEIFNKDTLHSFIHQYLPYGSFRIGVKGEDVDTVFVLNEVKSNGNRTSFDETLLKVKNDSNTLNNRVVEMLETQINTCFKDELLWCRKVQALYPIITMLFRDQTKVEIFVQIKTIKEYSDETNNQNKQNSEESIHGVSER